MMKLTYKKVYHNNNNNKKNGAYVWALKIKHLAEINNKRWAPCNFLPMNLKWINVKIMIIW